MHAVEAYGKQKTKEARGGSLAVSGSLWTLRFLLAPLTTVRSYVGILVHISVCTINALTNHALIDS